jgi:hypothetical protein
MAIRNRTRSARRSTIITEKSTTVVSPRRFNGDELNRCFCFGPRPTPRRGGGRAAAAASGPAPSPADHRRVVGGSYVRGAATRAAGSMSGRPWRSHSRGLRSYQACFKIFWSCCPSLTWACVQRFAVCSYLLLSACRPSLSGVPGAEPASESRPAKENKITENLNLNVTKLNNLKAF